MSSKAAILMKRSNRIAAFVRNYFQYLESHGVPAALLHGWEGGFEGEISDVDYVIETSSFGDVVRSVNTYCDSTGWCLRQVLRHENTAAFCVCSAADDPGCVVALDACSDYQRNGLVFLAADDLLKDRQPLTWGGFRLSPQMELRYRFIKAAAKAKKPADILPDLMAMEESARDGFPEWLQSIWKIELAGWSTSALESALTQLTRCCGPSQSRFRLANLRRLARRIANPDGLLLIVEGDDPTRIQAVTEVFSGLYFRHDKRVARASLGERMDLIRSSLVIASSASPLVGVCLDHDCMISPPATLSAPELIQQIAGHLHQRCLSRELR